MERMPSASEMERYKQEMMNMYRRANPNARTTGQSVTTVSETVAPPRQASGSNADQTAQGPAGSATATPVREQSGGGTTILPCDDISAPSTQNIQPSTVNRPEAGSAPQGAGPVTTNIEVSPQRDSMDDIPRPHFPEDYPAEEPFPEEDRPRRQSDVPTIQGTGEPAAADEDARIESAQTAYPGGVITDAATQAEIAAMTSDDISYTNNPLPEDYTDKYNETGYIRVKASSSFQALPIKNAAVVVSKTIDGQTYVLYRETTDLSGLTPNMPLPAPDDKSSTSPAGTGEPRFASYDMVITREGYVPVIYRSIPVFSGVVTVQPVQMVPQSNDPGAQKVMQYTAPQPDNL